MASHDDILISSVFSSIVKTSLSQQKQAIQAQQSSAKKKPPTLGGIGKSDSVKIDSSSESVQNQDDSWVSVPSKKKGKHVGAGAAKPTTKAASTKSTLKLASLEDIQVESGLAVPTKMVAQTSVAKTTSTNKFKALSLPFLTKSQLTNYEPGKPKQTKCSLKNQKRNARRRAAKEEKNKLLLEHQHDNADSSTSTDVTQEIVSVCQTVVQDSSEMMSPLLEFPYALLTEGVLSFLRPEEIANLGACSRYSKKISEEGYLWQTMFKQKFPESELSPKSMREWKRVYRLRLTNAVDRLRCFATRKTFFDDEMGIGAAFTVNPLKQTVDYINLSQDLLSSTAFHEKKIRADTFGNKFELFLPLYFSKEHFQRALPLIRKTITRLATLKGRCRFDRFEEIVIDVLPKIVNTFAVLLSDQGIAASKKSFAGLLRIHRLFLALAHEYPDIKRLALFRLRNFISGETFRMKDACPILGTVLPLLMVVDEKDFSWKDIRGTYLTENFDRCVLWCCKKYPGLERTHDASGTLESPEAAEKRIIQSLDAMTVSLRLCMFHVHFYKMTCEGTTSHQRANRYDLFFGLPEPEDKKESTKLNFANFRDGINHILAVDTWSAFFSFVGMQRPKTKEHMADCLRQHVKNSLRKKYHKKGMDFSRVQASGTSQILSKGQQYSASSDLQRVVFTDVWGFKGSTKFLDATCLIYDENKELKDTVDYSYTRGQDGAIVHSGDMMREDGGTHTIHIDLAALGKTITTLVFVISAFHDATLLDIVSPSISFADADADADDETPLCTYDLDSHDKVSYLTSVIMCKLYRTKGGGWHVQAIGDAHKGQANNYGPIYDALKKLL